MLTYALFIDCRESHIRTFSCQIHQSAKGNFGNAKILTAPID